METNFIKKLERAARAMDRIPKRAAVVAVNFSKERFVRKNWVDKTRKPWKSRKRKDRGSLMVHTGRLKRSIRVLHVTNNYVVIGTNVPYAKAHNEGETIKKKVVVKAHNRRTRSGRNSKVTAHPRQMNTQLPERRFMGNSALLARRIERLIERDLNNALK